MNYRELSFIAISIAIMTVTLLTVIYMPHVRALLIAPTTTTIYTTTKIYTSTTVTVTSINSSTTTVITTTVTVTSTTVVTASQTVTTATTVTNKVTSTTTVTTVTQTATVATVTQTATATATSVVYSTVSTTWLSTTVTTVVTASTTARTVVSTTATTTVTKTSTSAVYTSNTTVTVTSTNTIPTTITSTVTGTEYLYKNTTSVTFVVARSVTTTIPITQYVNTTVVKYSTTQTALYSMSNYVTVMNTTYVVLSSTIYVTMSRTISLGGYYTVYVTPTVVAVRTVSANATKTTTITITNNVTQLTVYLRNLEKMDVTFTVNGTATLTTVYVARETVIVLGTAAHSLRLINSTTYVTITNFYNITYVKGTTVSTMYVRESTTTVSYTRYTRATIYSTSYVTNGTVTVTSTVAPRVRGFTVNVSGAFLSAAFYISVGPQAYANVFYLNPSTVVALLGNYTPVNATMYVVYNGTTLATVTAGEVSTIYSAPPNVTAYVTAPSYAGTFVVYDANVSPVSYLSEYEDLAYIAFVIGVGLLSNLFFRGNRLHAIIGMISVAILGGIVGYAFGIPLAYTSMATVVLVISAAILAIVERNRETMISE